VELFGKQACGDHPACAGEAGDSNSADCSPCTDFVLGSADLGPSRPDEYEHLTAPGVHGHAWSQLPPDFRPSTRPAPACVTRGPPGAERASTMVSRCIVLRL
jgi:hypothetical protein